MNILRSKDGVILKFCQLIKYYTIDLVLYKENVHGKKIRRKCAPETSSRRLYNFDK